MSKINEKAMKSVLNNIDSNKLAGFIKQVDKNFAVLSTNQVFMQENQVEFGKYLDQIVKDLDKIKKELGIDVHDTDDFFTIN